jgi:hypothetical protein
MRATLGHDSPTANSAGLSTVTGLVAIRITSEAGRSHRVTLTMQLEEAAR